MREPSAAPGVARGDRPCARPTRSTRAPRRGTRTSRSRWRSSTAPIFDVACGRRQRPRSAASIPPPSSVTRIRLLAAVLDLHPDAPRARVERVLDELLHDARGALDHLAGRDAVRDLRRKDPDHARSPPPARRAGPEGRDHEAVDQLARRPAGGLQVLLELDERARSRARATGPARRRPAARAGAGTPGASARSRAPRSNDAPRASRSSTVPTRRSFWAVAPISIIAMPPSSVTRRPPDGSPAPRSNSSDDSRRLSFRSPDAIDSASRKRRGPRRADRLLDVGRVDPLARADERDELVDLGDELPQVRSDELVQLVGVLEREVLAARARLVGEKARELRLRRRTASRVGRVVERIAEDDDRRPPPRPPPRARPSSRWTCPAWRRARCPRR